MNNYYPKPTFPSENDYNQPPVDTYAYKTLPKIEEINLEDLLKMNYGKKITVHQTYPESVEWRDKEFRGILEGSSREFLIISDPSTGKWEFLYNIFTTYITFDEEINYHSKY